MLSIVDYTTGKTPELLNYKCNCVHCVETLIFVKWRALKLYFFITVSVQFVIETLNP